MNTFIQCRFGLLATAFLLFLSSCTSNNTDSNKKQNVANQSTNKSAPLSLQGTALAFDITKTELLQGADPRLARDGSFKYYFFADRLFIDGRDYNGFAWGSEYKVDIKGNQSDIVQQIKVQENGANLEVTVKTQLTYLTPNSGTFEVDVNQNHSMAGLLHYRHAGTFQSTDTKLDMMAKGLPNSNLDLMFQNISANEKNIDLKPGSKLTMNFSGPQYAKFTLNDKVYETKDYQLIAVDTFNKTIKGTFHGDTPFEIQLHFDQFYFGKFEVTVGNGAFKASGAFMSSRWIPIADYKVQGKFTDGLKYKSKHTSIEYPYSVYLPPNYATSNKKYPVLYLTDGQWVKEFHKAVEAHHKDFIVVAIEQGPEDRRMVDYRLPGALPYIRFLKEEIIPHIEKQYRTNANRIFWGASLGATVGEILLSQETQKKPYFSTYALSDGAFWANSPEIQEKVKSALAQPKSETISIFTSGTRQGNYITNLDFVNRVQSLNNSTLDIKNIELKETHNEMATPTFEYFIDAMH
ncbi:MAG TPA: alpha/beta hydrolase-fold protein [Cellvibrio sp.]|nr:alpha/beta hydrolase-fold protein [Cellvibrio sp.]